MTFSKETLKPVMKQKFKALKFNGNVFFVLLPCNEQQQQQQQHI